MIQATEEIWADADGNPVPFGDERGETVLVGKGQMISPADAKKYGLVKGEDTPAPTVDTPPLLPTNLDTKAVTSDSTENKAVKAPKENK